MYSVKEISGPLNAVLLHDLNALEPDKFPPLTLRHIWRGYWWFAYEPDKSIVGFAGMVAMVPFPSVGYLKRAYVAEGHRGHGIQLKFLEHREAKARKLGWKMLVSECSNNPHSEANFCKAGYTRFKPEQPWGEKGSVYFKKELR